LRNEEYERLVEEAEMLQDVRAYDEAKKAIAEGEELIPGEVTYAILDGGNPVRVWREHRGLTQQQLAEAVGISVPYLSQIESGKRRGSAEVLAAIAKELGLSLDDIVGS
jgi:DNA-binding XRE family transcriptional regulator